VGRDRPVSLYPSGVKQRLRGALLTAVACVLAVLGASAGAFAYYRERTSVPALSTTRWFTDGPRWTVGTQDDKAMAVTSQISVFGTEPLAAMSPSAGNAVREEFARHDHTVMWTNVTTLLFRNGNHINMPEVLLASEDGVSQAVGYGGVLVPVTFEPAQQVLPAAPRLDTSWSQQGANTWRGQDMGTYRLEASVEEITADGCVSVRTRLRMTMSELAASVGGQDSDDTSTSTYCPGEWVTAVDGDVDTSSVGHDEAESTLEQFRP
jgi:hypothetical protein